jgi:hypothetical protein
VPLQNRVSPFGELCAFCARGLFMGNRGGRFHTDAKTLTRRRWASRQWICCVLDFKGCRRVIWGRSYTELFFLDEPIAFAAGHRPCFECRRKDAEAFAEKWCEARRLRRPPYAAEMDEVLHAERLRERAKRLHRRHIDESDFGSGKVRHTTHHVRSLVGLGRSGHEHCRVVPPDAFCNHSTEKFCESIALAWKSLGH